MPNRHVLDVAYGRAHADVIIDNGQLVNVITGEVYPAAIAIADGLIAKVGDVEAQRGPDTKIIDAAGRFMTPGLIDGHLHLECSKLSVTMFSDLVSRYGTTSVVSSLDQTLVVAGIEGVKAALAETIDGPMRIWWGAPAKAPYTVPETNVGHRFAIAEHQIAQTMPECVGIWETVQEMIEYGDEEVLGALDMAKHNRHQAFGCAPLSDARRIPGQAVAGIMLDHESYSPEEELEKLRNGISILIRESVGAPMLRDNIKLVTEMGAPTHRIGFVTDDVSASDVLGRGHLDYVIRLAVEQGVPAMDAIQMATVNTARMFRLDHLIGCIAPGRYADIIFTDSLENFRAQTVITGGRVVAHDNKSLVTPAPPQRPAIMSNTFAGLAKVDPERIKVTAQGTKALVQTIVLSKDIVFHRPGEQVTLDVIDGIVQPSIEKDTIMVAVAERYGKTDHLPVAFIKGFGLKTGAIATSNAPDDNNIVVAGTNATDMAAAINAVAAQDGGLVVVKDGTVIASLPLPVCGIVADLTAEQMEAAEKVMDEAARTELGSTLDSPFTQLMFLLITSIPEWAITDLGLIDCVNFVVTPPVISSTID